MRRGETKVKAPPDESNIDFTSTVFDNQEQRNMLKIIKKAQEGDFDKDNLGETVRCFRCKLYGHKSSSKECPLYRHGKKLAETERKIRMDPMVHLEGDSLKGGDPSLDEKILKLMTLVRLVKEERKSKKRKRKKKKKDTKKRKRDEMDEGLDEYSLEHTGRKRRKL